MQMWWMYPSHNETGSPLRLQRHLSLYVIHLSSDLERARRLSEAHSSLPSEVVLSLVPAIHGRTLTPETCLDLTGDPRWAKKRGTIACFLSHARAWSCVAKDCEDYALVVEDDVDLDGVRMLGLYDIPRDADLVFVNDRMAPTPKIWPHLGATRPIQDVLEHLEQTHHMGADGSLLSQRGARILCDACSRDGYYGHVDGRLLRYCTSMEDLEPFREGSWISDIVMNHHNPSRPPQMGILRGYSLWPSLVSHAPAGAWDSTRAQIDDA
jgi:GR25 family glycosyltransferase involved in LPS biosynthesis